MNMSRQLWDALMREGFGDLTLAEVERLRPVLPLLVLIRRGRS